MNRTKIEWVKNPDGSPGYTLNPASGCENHTPEGLCLGGLFPCYAYKLAHGRLKGRYLQNLNIALPHENPQEAFANPFYPRFWKGRLLELRGEGAYDNAYPGRNAYSASREKEKGIFVCDMGDLFGIGVPEEWTKKVMEQIKMFFQHRFYLLTKQPQNLIKWSPFPENCWVGVTATNEVMFNIASNYMARIEAKVKYYSFEPLLHWDFKAEWDKDNECLIRRLKDVDWLIIAACTGSHDELWELCKRYPDLTIRLWGKKWIAQPRIEWVAEIVEAADKAGIKVFLKDNLYQLYLSNPQESCHWMFKNGKLRQEMPE